MLIGFTWFHSGLRGALGSSQEANDSIHKRLYQYYSVDINTRIYYTTTENCQVSLYLQSMGTSSIVLIGNIRLVYNNHIIPDVDAIGLNNCHRIHHYSQYYLA